MKLEDGRLIGEKTEEKRSILEISIFYGTGVGVGVMFGTGLIIDAVGLGIVSGIGIGIALKASDWFHNRSREKPIDIKLTTKEARTLLEKMNVVLDYIVRLTKKYKVKK